MGAAAKVGLFAVALSAAPAVLDAQDTLTGNYWQKKCSEPLPFECLRFVQGMDEMHALKTGPKLYCLPRGVTVGQIQAVATKYLNDHPGERHLPFVVLAAKAVQNSFPCR